ncbi:MAG: hypothetical protein ACR2J9_07075 [Gaiellales bacterium]
MVITVIAIALAGAASSACASTAGKQRVVQVSAQVAPMTPLDGAAITVTDADGNIVGTGRTVNAGAAEVAVRSGRLPLLLTTTGGTVRGRPFEGHLQAFTTRTKRADGLLQVSFVTTVAARYRELYNGKVKSIENRIYQKLGLKPIYGPFQVRYGIRSLRGATLLRRARAIGGYDVGVDDLVARLHSGKPFPRFAGARADQHPTYSSSPSTRASSTPPCPATVLPTEGPTPTQTVVNYGLLASDGLLTAFADADPYTLVEGAAGMVFGESGATNDELAAALASISVQLTCISQQIAQLQQSVDSLKLQTSLNNIFQCESAISTQWPNYQGAVANANANPSNPAYAVSTTSLNWQLVFNGIGSMMSTCSSDINQALFNAPSTTQSAWQIMVANTKQGDNLSTDSVALQPSSVQNLQGFLQYYGTLEYQQMIMSIDWLNFQSAVCGTSQNCSVLSNQNTLLGTPCVLHAPSLADVEANGTAASYCQWQQNILDVWPGDTYDDEVGHFKSTTTYTASKDPNSVAGLAISAVPGSFGTSTSAYGNPATAFTTNYLNGSNINKYDSRWNAQNAWTSFNNQPASTYPQPYQAYFARQAPATGSPVYADLTGYTNFKSFFNSWLNATGTPATATSPAAITPSQSSDPGHVTFQILFADGELEGSGSPPTCSSTHDHYNDGNATDYVNTYTYGYYTAHNAVYSPSPWSENTGGILGGGTKSSNFNGDWSYTGQHADGCQSSPPIAWLKSRPWVQGGTAPGVPVVTSSGTINLPTPAYNLSTATATAPLTAANCPSCTWSLRSSTSPNMTISPSGVLSMKLALAGNTAQVTVVASAPLSTQVMPASAPQIVYSAPVTLNVTVS